MGFMDEEDDGRKGKSQPKSLENLGIEELEAYIVALRAEISRTEMVIAAKKAHRAGVEGLFRMVSSHVE